MPKYLFYGFGCFTYGWCAVSLDVGNLKSMNISGVLGDLYILRQGGAEETINPVYVDGIACTLLRRWSLFDCE